MVSVKSEWTSSVSITFVETERPKLIVFLFFCTISTMCIAEIRNLWTLDWEATVSNVASMIISGKPGLFNASLLCQTCLGSTLKKVQNFI